MALNQKVELLHRSSQRMLEALALNRGTAWWVFMKREAWLHLRRTLSLLLAIYRREENDGES